MGVAALFRWIYRRLDGMSTGESVFVTLVLGAALLLAIAVVAVILQHVFGWHPRGPPS